MNRILITGASGVLGSELTRLLNEKNTSFYTSGRTKHSSSSHHRTFDLLSVDGLENILDDVDTVFHLASATRNYNRQVDVEGTRRLLLKAKEKNIRHFIFISVAGTDQVPLKYYRIKWETEKVIQENCQHYSILRATQFHDLVDIFFHRTDPYPFIVFPKNWKVQPIEPRVVAKKLFEISQGDPTHSIENIGGKEILTTGELMHEWLHTRKLKKKIIFIPIPGKGARAIAEGKLTCTEIADESLTWKEWLQKKYGELT